MSKKEPLGRIGNERPRQITKKKLDRLTRDVLAAEEAGQSYGQYKANHPHTPDVDDDEPAPPLPVKDGKIMKTCIQCGQEYEHNPSRPTQLYCSDACKQRHYNEKRNIGPGIRVCRTCGAEFFAEHKNKAYCSTACRIKHNNSVRDHRGVDTGKTAQCVNCGSTFTMAGNQKKYCCVACYAESMRKREAARRRRKKQEEKSK